MLAKLSAWFDAVVRFWDRYVRGDPNGYSLLVFVMMVSLSLSAEFGSPVVFYATLFIFASTFWATFNRAHRLHDHARRDPLTRLPNRRAIIEHFDLLSSIAKRNDAQLALLYIDLDGFKPVNDQYGHDAGDELLCAVGRRLQKLMRKTDMVARIGGDEFLILLTTRISDGGIARAENRVRLALSRPFRISKLRDPVRISASVGAAVYPEDGVDIHGLADTADKRMFNDKRAPPAREAVPQ